MNKLVQTVDHYLKTIGACCPRLLNALHHSPEAVWGEIQAMESACHALDEAWCNIQGKSEVAAQMMTLMAVVRGQMAQQGLMEYQELAAFRENVLAIQSCANSLRNALIQSHSI